MDGTSRPSSPSRPTFVTPPAIWEPARDVVDPRDLADVKERADVERPSCFLGEGVAGIEGCSRPSSRSDAEAEGESAGSPTSAACESDVVMEPCVAGRPLFALSGDGRQEGLTTASALARSLMSRSSIFCAFVRTASEREERVVGCEETIWKLDARELFNFVFLPCNGSHSRDFFLPRIHGDETRPHTPFSSNPTLHASAAASLQSTGRAVSPRSICESQPLSVLPAPPAAVSSPLDHSSVEVLHQ